MTLYYDIMQLICVSLYRKYNLIVYQKWINIHHLDLSCNKFYMQSAAPGNYTNLQAENMIYEIIQ